MNVATTEHELPKRPRSWIRRKLCRAGNLMGWRRGYASSADAPMCAKRARQTRGSTYPGSRNSLARFAEQRIQVRGVTVPGSRWRFWCCSGKVARIYVSRFAEFVRQARGTTYAGSQGNIARSYLAEGSAASSLHGAVVVGLRRRPGKARGGEDRGAQAVVNVPKDPGQSE